MRFSCETCDHSIKVPDAYAGKKGRCPRCKIVLRVPALVNAVAIATPALTPARKAEARSALTDVRPAPANLSFKISGIAICIIGVLVGLNAVLGLFKGALIGAMIVGAFAYGMIRVGIGLFNDEKLCFYLAGVLGALVIGLNLLFVSLLLDGGIVYFEGIRLGWGNVLFSLALNVAIYVTPVVHGIKRWRRIDWQ